MFDLSLPVQHAIELIAACAGATGYLYWAFVHKAADVETPDAAVNPIPADIEQARRSARIEADYAPKHFRKS